MNRPFWLEFIEFIAFLLLVSITGALAAAYVARKFDISGWLEMLNFVIWIMVSFALWVGVLAFWHKLKKRM
jgi:hypothetical protein